MTETFSQRIAQLRKNKKISQKTAAADLGISQALLSHYERGIRECGLELLTRMADYYGVSADYLLCRSDVENGGVITGRESEEFVDLMNAVQVTSDLLKSAGNDSTAAEFLSLVGINVARVISMIVEKGGSNLFQQGYAVRNAGFEAAMRFYEARLCNELEGGTDLSLSMKDVKETYPVFYSSVKRLLEHANGAVRIIVE